MLPPRSCRCSENVATHLGWQEGCQPESHFLGNHRQEEVGRMWSRRVVQRFLIVPGKVAQE
ncbi:hypothetical protein HETIRDRAFT_316146 [Heterobasidion irregulare TC 32-1]|uniref:Uncharacterized protein n=1 Tax=Heterobasidion irregulare (strain TC 32-1) TaxID=747525 RepID=W4K9B5_HETIT|nr:uncharacterized protein HETIRDRAFT_316146 [Heterobasidion irregulare TC 32-1]ETW82427.1 hypothetical protein HETIRDRAFT_316146 [Heterobasidion irregulare TC 32-1]